MTKKQTTFFSSWLFLSLSSFFPSLVRTSAKVQVLFDSSRSPSQDMTHTHYQTQTTHTIVSLLVGWDGGNFFKGLKRNEKENEKISKSSNILSRWSRQCQTVFKKNNNLYYTMPCFPPPPWFSPFFFLNQRFELECSFLFLITQSQQFSVVKCSETIFDSNFYFVAFKENVHFLIYHMGYLVILNRNQRFRFSVFYLFFFSS